MKVVIIAGTPKKEGLSCQQQMEWLCQHLHAKIFDFVGVNRWNIEYKLVAIRAAASAMVQKK